MVTVPDCAIPGATVVLRYAVRINGIDTVALTKLDVLVRSSLL